MNSEVRVRFAPSPTGYLHVGGARTALFNYLFARHNKGKFILRIEDTDQKRFQETALEEIFESLKWLDMLWDEGPDKGGEYGPYVQSQRTELYKKHAQELIEKGYAYCCFCTPERIQKLREEQQRSKMQAGSGYDRLCRDLSEKEIQNYLNAGKPFVIRLKVPEKRTVVFNDLIRGEIEYRCEVLDDLVMLKSDGFPTYHLANVVDDHYMKISHVLRGEEWIASTPRHILIYEAFGWPLPQFAHMPVILAEGGGKLSKRKGAASVIDYKKGGILPEALFNFLALLGWAPGENREIMTEDEIIDAFTLDRITPKASVFDEKKLEWMNGHYLRERSIDSIVSDVVTLWKEMGIVEKDRTPDEPYFGTVVSLLKDRSKRITDLATVSAYFFVDPADYEAKAVKKHFKRETIQVLDTLIGKFESIPSFDRDSIETVFREYVEESGMSAGKLIHPTRLAVSGISYGPGLFELLETLGKETVIRRMKLAIEWIEENKFNSKEE